MSWKPEVQTDSTGKWYGNALRFASEQEALDNVHNLASRWLAVLAVRVVEVEDPVAHTWSKQDGLGFIVKEEA